MHACGAGGTGPPDQWKRHVVRRGGCRGKLVLGFNKQADGAFLFPYWHQGLLPLFTDATLGSLPHQVPQDACWWSLHWHKVHGHQGCMAALLAVLQSIRSLGLACMQSICHPACRCTGWIQPEASACAGGPGRV